jgi:PAS domain S-box-containing protein
LIEDILDSLQQAVLLADDAGRILYSSPMARRITGQDEADLAQRDLTLLFTAEDLVYLYPNLLYLARRGQPFEGEVMLRRKNDARFFAFLVMRPYQALETSRNVIIFCFRDIDQQKQFEHAMRETHFEDLIRIANGIAHEIRNPLVGIGGFARRLHKACSQEGERDQYYGFIVRNLKRIESLVQKVDYLVSLPKPDFRRHSMEHLLMDVVDAYRPDLERRHIDFDCQIVDAEVLVDANHVARAVGILVENALDAVAEGGRIRVHGHAGPLDFQIGVTDNGRGIAPTDLPFIFNPFFSTKAEGAGIDLAVVKRIMEGHGGRVEVNSTPGQGAWFVLHFPHERRRPIRVTLLEAQPGVDTEWSQ